MTGRKKKGPGELLEKGRTLRGLRKVLFLDRCVILIGFQEQSEKRSNIQVLYCYQNKDRSIPFPNS